MCGVDGAVIVNHSYKLFFCQNKYMCDSQRYYARDFLTSDWLATTIILKIYHQIFIRVFQLIHWRASPFTWLSVPAVLGHILT